MAQRVTIQPAPFAVELPDFASRILYVRCIVLRLNRLKMAELIGYPHASLANWEQGRMPHQLVAVAKAYAQVAREVEPRITAGWLLDGESNLPLYEDRQHSESVSRKGQLLENVA